MAHNLARAFILSIGDDGVFLLPPPGLKKSAPFFLPAGENADPLWAALSLAPRRPVVLLADTLAQAFKRDVLPPLSAWDKKKLSLRRLEQNYPHASLRTALDEASGSVLLASVETEGPVGFWLDRLAAVSNPSGQVCSLPLESADLLAKLAPASAGGWGLLLASHKTGGFRQIVTRSGELIFTRLTPPLPALAHPDTVAESLAQDLQATRSYLARFGLTDETPLHLAALLPPALHQSFSRQALPVASQLLFSPREAAARLNLPLPPQPDEPLADLVSALWLQSKPWPRAILMRPAEARDAQTRRVQKAGSRVALVALATSLLYAGIEGQALYQTARANATATADVASLEATLTQARRTLAHEAAPLETLRKAVERRRLFTAPHPGPQALLSLLHGALGSEAKVIALDWQDETLKIDLLLKEDETHERLNELKRQKITRAFDNLAFLLRDALDGYDVEVARYPYPTLPDETITNKEPGSKEPPPIATFVIRKEAS